MPEKDTLIFYIPIVKSKVNDAFFYNAYTDYRKEINLDQEML